MNYLLDTHVFLWSLLETERLSKKTVEILEDPKNNIFVSALTFWEISMKYVLGKIELDQINPSQLPDMAAKLAFGILELRAEDARNYHTIVGKWHRDTFDRMLILQAMENNLILISKDEDIGKYAEEGLKVEW